MAITRAQQAKQMLQNGGMLVQPGFGGTRQGYRGEGGYRGGPGGSKDKGKEAPASADFKQDAKPGEQSPQVYGASGPYDPQQALAAAKAQGAFDKKNPIEKFVEGYTGSTRRTLYNIFPNNPTNELDYLRSLPASQRALLSPALRAKLEAFELDEDQDLLDTAKTKFTFDEFEELRKFQPTEGLNFAEYAAKFKGAPGLLYSGDVGNLITIRNPDGTFRYERRTDDGPNQPIIPVNKTFNMGSGNMDQGTDTAEGDDEDLFRRFRADGGIMNSDVVGGEFDFESARQMYGLGKLVKKATRAVKKIAKSPIGKAALIAGGGYLLGGGIIPGVSGKLIPFAKYGSSAGSGFGFGNILPNLLNIAKMPGLAEKAFSMGTTGNVLTGILGASAVAGLLTPAQEAEAQRISDETGIDINEIRNNPDKYLGRRFKAGGGLMRLGYDEAGAVLSEKEMKKLSKSPLYKGFKTMYKVDPDMAKDNPAYGEKFNTFEQLYKKGFQEGGDVEPVAKKTMPLLDMDGKEKDYRETGGFVDMGRMERADDVPARLSKNEFVFTADAVRNAGDGSVDKGAEVMYNMMKNLEAGGEVSEESQGLEGARRMFQTSQRLGEVI